MMETRYLSISKNRAITTELPAFIAGIINITGDSFCPVGKCPPSSAENESTESVERAATFAAETALKLIKDGADIIDVGAESTRPGSRPITEEEELRRLIPALKAIRSVTSCPISVDTSKAVVMKAALEAGADMLNDVSALQNDILMAKVCSEAEIPVILMHNHDIISYVGDIPELVAAQLSERVIYAVHEGIKPEKIILDPGIGFGKSYEQNLSLMTASGRIREIVMKKTGLKSESLFPVMMALSRKSCIGRITGKEVEERLAGTLAADLIAVQSGASFVRVHDVAETRDMLITLNALKKKE